MPRPPNQELINRLMGEMETQREIIEQAKEARRIMRELNRVIAALGGVPQEIPTTGRSGHKDYDPVVPRDEDGMYHCPECERAFMRPQGLGAHRKMTHGVKGSKQQGGEE